MKQISVTIRTVLYANQHGRIDLVTDFYLDGAFETCLFVIFPDGFGDECESMFVAMEKLR